LEIACEKLGTTAEELKKRTLQRLPEGERAGGRFEVSDECQAVKREAGDEPAKLLQRAEAAAAAGSGRGLIERLVRKERAVQPRLGGRKLLHMLKPQLALAGITIGRDLFFGVLRALEMALAELPQGVFAVHHSDRGCQYCSHRYVETLRERGLAVSMTEDLHCYENANAERLNGILKQEYGLGVALRNKRQALRAIDEAVLLYNTRRPHFALGFETPANMHRRVA
jgi:hypothetical protein